MSLPYAANDPRIGQLIREGRTIHYAYIGGLYFEHADPLEVAAHLWAGDNQQAADAKRAGTVQ